MSINRHIFAFVILWLSILAYGQNQENSPYSRFGIGELVDPHFSSQGNMGGWTAAYTDINFLNYLNPASLGTLSATSMELGLYGRHNTLKDRFNKNTQWGGNLSHLALGFPIRNPVNDAMNKIERNFFWGTGLTVTPFSRTSYNIRTIEFVEGAGRVRRNYSGDGGTYKLLLGNGFRYKDFSVGLNAGLLLGSIERERIIALDDFINSFTEYFEDKQTFRSFLWSAGVQYRLWLKRPDKNAAKRISRYLMLGAYGNTSTALNTELDRNYIKANDLLKVVDTILSENGTRFNTRMPGQYTLGASFVDENKFRIGFDFTQTFWSQFESPIDNVQMKNTWNLNTGFEYIPNINSIGKFTNRVRYRAGLRLGQDPRSFNDQLNRFEINAGVGLPFVISREVSYLHLGVSYGKIYGNNIPVTENYFRINFGFTFIDNSWFVKRKFY